MSYLYRVILSMVFIFPCFVQTTIAQDVKFSQYFASPLTVNPALCGIFSGKYRFQGNYRNQWQNIEYPYTTATASGEIQLQGEDFQDDILAVGFYGLTDRSNNGGLSDNVFSGTVSFHKVLDEQNYSRIGAGLQVAYTSKMVDYSKMTFETQFTPIGYSTSLPTGELTNGFSINHFDYSAGILYSYFSGDINFYAGASASHLTRPTETYGLYAMRVPMSLTFHGGGSFAVGETNTLYYSLMHMRTSQSYQTTFGLVYGLNLNGEEDNSANEFLIGSWLRLNDAVVPYLGLKMGSVQAGVSYDITTSKVTIADEGQGGMELSLQVILNSNPNKETLRRMKCKFMMY